MDVTAAFLMLAHDNLDEAGQVAGALGAGDRAVAVHIDARAPDADVAAFQDAAGDPLMIQRRRCEWGMFSLVGATLDGLEMLVASGRDFSHVMLVSGADLPLRPLADLDAFLAANPDADIIESVELSEKRWVMDGLAEERFHLYHPFNWRKRKGLFDANVEVQRFLKVRRSLPPKIAPALGSQWWCLSRATVEGILADPQLSDLKQFFRWSWIPDECFFQTLVRRHGSQLINMSPTLARFNDQGLPFTFYDDHGPLLDRCDHFFARKVHPRAINLRKTMLARAADLSKSDRFKGKAPEDEFIRARRDRTHGREHLLSPARFPRLKGKRQLASAFPYTVIGGVGGQTAEVISRELSKRGDILCHARLFASGEVRFHSGDPIAPGCLPASPQARDFWPDQYIINLARGAAGSAAAFCFAVEDRHAIGDYIAADPGAKIIWYRGAWALDLFRRAQVLDEIGMAERAIAASVAERGQLAAFRKAGAALTMRSAADLIDAPENCIADMLDVANARASRRDMDIPDFAPPRWDRARPVLRALQRAGCEVEAGLIAPT